MFIVTEKIQTFSKFLHNLPSDWLENILLCYSSVLQPLRHIYLLHHIWQLLLEHFPIATGSYLISTPSVVQNVLQLSSCSSFICIYCIVLYIGNYDIFFPVTCFKLLFVKLTGESLTFSNIWSGGTLFGIFSTFECLLIDLLNIHLYLPGNLLCFIPSFKKFVIEIFVQDWHGKPTHLD